MFAAGDGADPDIDDVECEHAAASPGSARSSNDCLRARKAIAMTNVSLGPDE
jgi:hypothetical protein